MSVIPSVYPGARNRLKQTSFETPETWVFAFTGSASGTSGRSTEWAYSGVNSVRFSVSSSTSSGPRALCNATHTANRASVTPGEALTASGVFRTNNTNVSFRLTVQFYNSSGGSAGSSQHDFYVGTSTPTNTNVRVVTPEIVVPATAVTAAVNPGLVGDNNSCAPSVSYIDGLMLSVPEDNGFYVDGSLGPDHAWLGAAWLSESIRHETYSVGVLGVGGQEDLQVRYYRSNRNNDRLEDITGYITSGSIDSDVDRRITTLINLQGYEPAVLKRWTWVSVYGMLSGENRPTDVQQIGLFRLEQPRITGDASGATVEVKGLDPVVVMDNYRVKNTYNVDPGTNVRTAIVALINLCGLSRHSIPETTKTLTGAKSYNVDSSALDIANDLAAYAGLYSMSSTPDGMITTRSLRERDRVTPARDLKLGVGSRLIGPLVSESSDSDFANEIVAVKENQDAEPWVAVAVNNDPGSVVSTVYDVDAGGPGVVTKTVKVTDVADLATLQSTANEELRRRNIAVAGTLQIMPDLSLSVFDVINLTIDTDSYPHLSEMAGKWNVQQITYGLTTQSAFPTVKVRRNEFN